ncbi:ferrous iron transport protein B [Clostridium cavendishii DSM 21758]|uniref:Ferrous iron transport protein B n=1 Tax=Clostridium cavendishii DSM 21758 TaxID=1121302 RepID=A0A1M6FG80_9CLOT|nr:ferrous iron transport protein B [Clostridium cavendishii]SHI96657.1 ferrous iron transport protein B [Clostridium cavendishii DSM 21758]
MTTIALLGNPNVGKTTLFNELTGSNQHVGNWAGVTVEKKEGFYENIKIVDLPGIYAMDTFSNEEKVSKNFLENEQVDAILNIVDASNLDRNLYLTFQLKKFKKPIILVVNMIDVAEKKGIILDLDELEKKLKVRVISLVASKGTGISEVQNIIKSNNFEKFKDDINYDFKDEGETYRYIESILKSSIKSNKNADSLKSSEKIDKVFLNPFLAYPLFILIMIIIFEFTFSWVGLPLSDLLKEFVSNNLSPFISNLLTGTSPWFKSLIVNGIIAGVFSIIALLPVILALFFCISLLEDSGYMARVAFIMDKLMRKVGLSGKAFIPMVVGFGCSVPAIMSARTLESEKDRKLTALLVPLMSCNARLPVYAIFASVFFKGHASLVVASLYFLGVIMAFLIGLLFKNTIFKKDEEPFIIELPEYKLPEPKNVIKNTWDKGKGFLKKAGTVIFAVSVLIWFLQNFNFNGITSNINDSFLFSIGSFIAPVFKPLGFGTWQASVSLLTGILAKETVLSTMEVIYLGDLSTVLPNYFTQISAYAFMAFVLLYTPCVSVIGAMKKEYGNKMTLFSITYQLTLAWIVAFIIYNLGSLIL